MKRCSCSWTLGLKYIQNDRIGISYIFVFSTAKCFPTLANKDIVQLRLVISVPRSSTIYLK